jgi:hypothetical protein
MIINVMFPSLLCSQFPGSTFDVAPSHFEIWASVYDPSSPSRMSIASDGEQKEIKESEAERWLPAIGESEPMNPTRAHITSS